MSAEFEPPTPTPKLTLKQLSSEVAVILQRSMWFLICWWSWFHAWDWIELLNWIHGQGLKDSSTLQAAFMEDRPNRYLVTLEQFSYSYVRNPYLIILQLSIFLLWILGLSKPLNRMSFVKCISTGHSATVTTIPWNHERLVQWRTREWKAVHLSAHSRETRAGRYWNIRWLSEVPSSCRQSSHWKSR